MASEGDRRAGPEVEARRSKVLGGWNAGDGRRGVLIALALIRFAYYAGTLGTFAFLVTWEAGDPKVPPSAIRLRHILRNAVLSTITIFGLQFGFLIGGALVVETVFAIPGLGQLLFTSITSRDYPVVQAITVITALMVILVNLIVDLSYSFLDPRLTYG